MHVLHDIESIFIKYVGNNKNNNKKTVLLQNLFLNLIDRENEYIFLISLFKVHDNKKKDGKNNEN